MKKRYKISLALGTAACLVALLAVALAAGGMGRVHTDVVAAPGVNAVPEESVEVYFTEQGRYYHSRIDCSGMQGARAGTEEEAWSLNKRPCPVCLGGEAAAERAEEAPEPEEEWVFCTENGRYYHSDVHCSGMRGAREVKLSEATAGGKLPCPVCMAGGSETSMLLVTPEPTELPFVMEADVPAPPMAEPEAEENASEDVAVTPEPTQLPVRMEEAGAEIEAYEEAPGPTLTPVPLEEAGAEGEEAPMVLHREDAQTVYYTQGGKYYHGFDSCSGMHFAEMHTLSDARKAGKERCPKCLPGGEPEHMDLFRSALGLEIGEAFPGSAYVYQTSSSVDAVSWVLLRWEGSAHTSWPAVICWQLADGTAVLSLDVREAQDLEAIRTRATTPVAAICRADLDAAAAAGGHPFPGLSEAQCVELRLYFRQDGTLSEVEQTLNAEAEAFVALWEMGSGKADLRQIRRVDGETWQAPEGTLTVN